MSKIEDHKTEALLQISRELCNPYVLDEFLQRIIDAAAELTDCQASSICIYEQETELLKFVATPRSHRERMRRFRIPLENSVAGKVFREQSPYIIQDATDSTLVYREVDEELPFVTHSIAAIPLIYRGETLGVIEALNKRQQKQFTEEDLEIMHSLADYAAAAIFNSALLEEAQLANEGAADLERLKSDFIAIASHEFRTPLGLILGHATFLNETIQLAQYKQQLEVILNNTMRLKNIIDDFANANLGKSGSTILKRQRVDMGAIIEQVVDDYKLDAQRKNINIQANLPNELLLVDIDPEKIGLALSNIVRNAVNFTEIDGRVLVTAEKLSEYVKVAVIDNGIGIPSREIKRIFERFYQIEPKVSRKHGGMGLGLPVAKTMIELHGGEIWAESIQGKGSNFSILLPAAVL